MLLKVTSLGEKFMISRFSQSIQNYYQLRSFNLYKFKAKIQIQNDLGPYQISTANTIEELKEAFALRFSVFHREFVGKSSLWGMDVDDFDFDCDHIVIKEKRSNKIVGTYRLRCSALTNKFYFSKQFELAAILQHPGVKVEIGRACIHKDYRQGIVMSLLWKGIADYVAASDANLVFGCASINSDDPRDAALLTQYFDEQGRINRGFMAQPTPVHTMPFLSFYREELRGSLTETQRETARDLLPQLCKSILNTGAFIGGEPSWDPDFRCLDFLTILHREDLNRSLWKRPFGAIL